MDEGLVKRGARVADGESDELHPSSVFLEGRDEGRVLSVLLRKLVVAAEVSTKADLKDEDDVLVLGERGWVW